MAKTLTLDAPLNVAPPELLERLRVKNAILDFEAGQIVVQLSVVDTAGKETRTAQKTRQGAAARAYLDAREDEILNAVKAVLGVTGTIA